LNREELGMTYLMKPCNNRFKIVRGVFRRPMKVISSNAYWYAKYKRLKARFENE